MDGRGTVGGDGIQRIIIKLNSVVKRNNGITGQNEFRSKAFEDETSETILF